MSATVESRSKRVESDERQIRRETQGGRHDVVQRVTVKDNMNEGAIKKPQLLCSAS